jgi:hypothetical protein
MNNTQQQPKDKDKDKQIKSDQPGYDHTVPFSALCQLLEKATKTKQHAKKKDLLQTFFKHYEDDNYFPVMRLLLPQVRVVVVVIVCNCL